MDVSRRKLFGIGAAITAAAAVPEIADARPADEAVGPILLERICDGGRSEMTPGEIAKWEADMREYHGSDIPKWFPGCGTKFQWYFNNGASVCPECGRAYLMTREMLKSEKYTVRK